MTLVATRLTEAHRCEIIVQLNKPNAPSKRALGQEYEVSEGPIRRVLETMRIEEEPPMNDEIQPSETFLNLKVLPTSKAFEALYSIVINIDDQLLCSDVQTEAGQMYDEL